MLEVIGLVLLLMLLLAIVLFWRPYIMSTTKFGAPFVPMELETVEYVMKLADLKPEEVFYELGSGDGRLVISAALRGARAVGVEIDRLRVLYSRAWIYLLRLHKRAQIIHDDIFKVDLSPANVVCLYLLQSTNERLLEKLQRELKPGTRVISVAFTLPNWRPVKVDHHGTVYGPIFFYIR